MVTKQFQVMMNRNPDYSTIEPHHFFSSHSEKTKFNWFAFELACEIERAISRSTKKNLSKKNYTQQKLNQSCINLAILLQGQILRKLRNETHQMEFNYTEVERAFPGLNDKTINQLLDSVGKAWDKLLSICVSCPEACISNRDDPCAMFDEEPQTAKSPSIAADFFAA